MEDLDFNCKLTLENLMEMAEPLLARLEVPITPYEVVDRSNHVEHQ